MLLEREIFMILLKDLQTGGQNQDDTLLEASGYGLWINWTDSLNPVLEQTLLDYGGIRIMSAVNQALWFFFSVDCFLALAKLEVWAKYNSLPTRIQVFEAGLRSSYAGRNTIILAPELWLQGVEPPVKFDVYVRGENLPQDHTLAGINLIPSAPVEGFCPGDWRELQADQRLPYKSSLGWFAVLKPLGNPVDKGFQLGWRDFYARLDDILRRNKLRFIMEEYFLMVPLESLRQFKQWCRDYLNLVKRSKADEKEGSYWPCVMGITEKKKLHFNNDLPRSVNLDWNQLMPDFPYISLRDGILLGNEFQIHEVRFANEAHTPDAWCNISLADEEEAGARLLPGLSPQSLIYGTNGYCFYCGQRSHVSQACPSRDLEARDPDIWKAVASLDLSAMKEGADEINRILRGNPEELAGLLKAENSPGVLTRAIFAVNGTVQLRSVSTFWKLRGRALPTDKTEQMAEDNNPIWGLLRSFNNRDPAALEKELQNMQVRFPHDYRVFSLHGFAAMERGDLLKAEEYWRQAHLLALPGSAQAWHMFLLGRLAEYQGQYSEAVNKYRQVLELAPSMLEAEYRILICHVKSGFVDRAIPMLAPLLAKEHNFFNWLLLDPELERGFTSMLYALSAHWREAENQAQEERKMLNNLSSELHNWFMEDSEFLRQESRKIAQILEFSEIRNFVPFQLVIAGRAKVERDFQTKIMTEIKNSKSVFAEYMDRLARIRDESAWFPFPKLLLEFNRSYNLSAANMNWITHNNLRVAPIFKKAQELIQQEKDRIAAMEKRLNVLRLVRDGTLFFLIMSKKFMWMELAGLALIFLVFPLTVYYGGKVGLSWVHDVFVRQQWYLQKAAIIVISVLSIIVATSWTILRFETMREKLLSKAKRQAEVKTREQIRMLEQQRKKIQERRQVAARRRKAQPASAPPPPGN